ncbi:hypothetical protein ParKJ_34245, partial [Paraburkholderia fungorum]|nr:hypothetical protein [Paraburkholderia fungorum]
MKKLLVAVAIGMTLNTPVLHAATRNTSPPQAASSPQAEDPAEFDKNVAQWQEKMNEMQAQMDQLRKAQDPKERKPSNNDAGQRVMERSEELNVVQRACSRASARRNHRRSERE